MSIHFDTQSMLTDFKKQLISAMKQLQEELLAEAKQKMLTPEGAEDLTAEQIEDIAGVITAGIFGGPWAVMDEFGTGSKMDPLNPALDDYMSSDLWNPVRGDYAIAGRKKGWYTNIFGKRVYSSGAYAGRGVESVYPPQSPSHAIQTAMRWMQNGRMKEVIQNTINLFPFGKYLITDKN